MRDPIALFIWLVLSVAAIAQPAVPSNGQAPPGLASGNVSATITTGNTFQTVLAASTEYSASQSGKKRRLSLTIENNNASDSCWVDFGVRTGGTQITAANATKAESIYLGAGGSYVRYFPYIPSDEIEATCTGTNDTLHISIQ